MPTISQAQTPAEIASVRELIREYIEWASTLDEGDLDAPEFVGIEQELAGLPGKYASPHGALLFATHEGEPVGCVGLRRFDEFSGEVKRLYVRPSARGLNLGRQLVDAVVAEAHKRGYRRLVLDSHVSMLRSHAIYEAAGFQRVPPPSGFPEAQRRFIVFMEMALE